MNLKKEGVDGKMFEKGTHKIAVLSDTHGLLRPEVKEILTGCEVILHGGDINSQKILDELKEIAPVYVVRGNNDKEWAEKLPIEAEIDLFGLHIYMVHNKKHRKQNLGGVDLFIYGHSHKYEEKKEEGVFLLNPGSCGPRRFRQPVTMAALKIEEDTGKFQVEKIDLTKDTENKPVLGVEEGNVKSVVEIIIREMSAGRKVELIAKRLGVECEFVEQVCRIYVTHPAEKMQIPYSENRPC